MKFCVLAEKKLVPKKSRITKYTYCIVAVGYANSILYSVDWPQYGYNNAKPNLKEKLKVLKFVGSVTGYDWKYVYRKLIGGPVYKRYTYCGDGND